MMELVFIAGARPNFVKIAPILHALRGSDRVRATLVHTGQHYDFEMSGVFFEQLGIPAPDAHLQVGAGTHGAQTGAIMTAFERYLLEHGRPRGVVVVGDVNSTMACALVSVKLGIHVTHVEAGLRSGDRSMPEEINRLVTDAVSDLLLVSEPEGLANLRKESISEAKTRYVGNVMIDSLVAQLPAARTLGTARSLGLEDNAYVVATLHRPSNVDDPSRLGELVDYLLDVSRDIEIIFPVHPRTEARLVATGLKDRLARQPRIRLTAPLGYREFIDVVAGAKVVITDSGGVQEETTFLGIPCITLRTTTERPITTSAGTNRLVGEDLAAARAAMTLVLSSPRGSRPTIAGWDGHAAERIVEALVAELSY